MVGANCFHTFKSGRGVKFYPVLSRGGGRTSPSVSYSQNNVTRILETKLVSSLIVYCKGCISNELSHISVQC